MSFVISMLRFQLVIAAVVGTHPSCNSCEWEAGLTSDKSSKLVHICMYIGILQLKNFSASEKQVLCVYSVLSLCAVGNLSSLLQASSAHQQYPWWYSECYSTWVLFLLHKASKEWVPRQDLYHLHGWYHKTIIRTRWMKNYKENSCDDNTMCTHYILLVSAY
jgi:hypothetical protein